MSLPMHCNSALPITTPDFLERESAPRLAYYRLSGKAPGIMFLGGFRSDMTGIKAMALEGFCRQQNRAFLRFDYQGHGQSEGRFEEGTIGAWLEDAADMLALAQGPQLLVGSSMGGWLALLLARALPERVAGIIGIAAAPDFTEYLIWDKLTKREKETMKRKGRIETPSDAGGTYPVTMDLIEEGRAHLLLHDTIEVDCPVRLLHGTNDADVPWETALSINEKLRTQDVRTILVEGGDHRLSTPADVQKLLRVTEKLLAGKG